MDVINLHRHSSYRIRSIPKAIVPWADSQKSDWDTPGRMIAFRTLFGPNNKLHHKCIERKCYLDLLKQDTPSTKDKINKNIQVVGSDIHTLGRPPLHTKSNLKW
jgi:hypothetical protein